VHIRHKQKVHSGSWFSLLFSYINSAKEEDYILYPTTFSAFQAWAGFVHSASIWNLSLSS
jgi:hypothetical protein